MGNFKSILTGAALAGCLFASAPAMAEESGWTMTELENNKGKPWGAVLIAKNADGREVGFRCFDGKLIAAFALEPSDMLEAFEDAGSQRAVDLTIAVDGATPEEQKWLHLRRHKIVASTDQKMSRRLYNAAARGETVAIDAKKRGKGEYALPEADPGAFSSFRAACGFSKKKSS